MDLRTLAHEIAGKISSNRNQYLELTLSTILDSDRRGKDLQFHAEISQRIVDSIYDREDIDRFYNKFGIQKEEIESSAILAHLSEFKEFTKVEAKDFKEIITAIIPSNIKALNLTSLLIYPNMEHFDTYEDLYMEISCPNMTHIEYKIKNKAKRVIKKFYPNFPVTMKVKLSDYNGQKKEEFDLTANKAIYFISLLLTNENIKPKVIK